MEATPPGLGESFDVGHALAYEPTDPPDIVISSLVTHHLDDASILRLLRMMTERARVGWFISELQRHPVDR